MTRRRLAGALAAVLVGYLMAGWPLSGAEAESYQRISGEGSSWAAGAINAMAVNVKQFGITVDYNPSGSSAGRKNFLNGTVDFAASDIPFQFRPEDGSSPEKPAPGSYAYIPVTAGGTAFMYNLKINGTRVTNLRLSGENVARIFTGVITKWNDPALKADNPGLDLPDRTIVPIVRSDGSGSTAQFSRWLIHEHGGIWNDYCARSDRAPACGVTSNYPTITGMIGQAGDLGVSSYITQGYGEGSIGYVNYSYAIGAQFPVAKVLNQAGYYTEPTPENVAVSLLKARINTDATSDEYLTQQLDDVYTDEDRRNYQLSSYSYFILPATVQGQFNTEKGKTLGAFTYYAMCQAQQQSASLGYSPMPINLVEAAFDQIRKIPGVVVQDIDVTSCKNPTFSPDGTNLLAQNAPMPQECDKQGSSQCETGTGGIKQVKTPVGSGGGAQTPAGGDAAGDPSAGNGGGGSIGNGTGTAREGSGLASTATSGTCDLDTGACGSSELAAGPTGGAGGRAVATSTTLAGSSGWSVPLIVLILLLTLALVFAPAATWRYLSDESRT